MKPSVGSIAVISILGLGISNSTMADSLVTVHVEVQNAPSADTLRTPVAGDYHFLVSGDQVRGSTPSGQVCLFDFGKKLVSVLDSGSKSFYQMKLDDYLELGDKLPSSLASRYMERSAISFRATSGQDSRTINGVPGTPYSIDLQATLERQAPQHSGRGGRRGGFPGGFFSSGQYPNLDQSLSSGQYPGSPSRQGDYLATSTGVKVGGELWMGNAGLPEPQGEELSVAELSLIMPNGPTLKALTDRIHRAKLAVLGADFSISVLDENGQGPGKPPSVSAKIVSIEHGTVDPDSFTIPASFSKIGLPACVLGTSK
jgi:hypothetical protein